MLLKQTKIVATISDQRCGVDFKMCIRDSFQTLSQREGRKYRRQTFGKHGLTAARRTDEKYIAVSYTHLDVYKRQEYCSVVS